MPKTTHRSNVAILIKLVNINPSWREQWCPLPLRVLVWRISAQHGTTWNNPPNSDVHWANMGPIWGRQDPGGPHVGPMNIAIRVISPLVPYVCITAYSAPSHYLNQWRVIVNWTPRNTLHWNFNQNIKLFIKENAPENIVREMAAILSRGRLDDTISTVNPPVWVKQSCKMQMKWSSSKCHNTAAGIVSIYVWKQ